MPRYANILETVGRTPAVKINRLAPAGINLYVKVEAFNPLGSVKDRLALGVIEAAEKSGELKPGQTVVEATSGNTGIGLAMVCAAKGYPLVVTMAETFSVERRKLMRFLGAKVVLTPAAERAFGMVNKAQELAKTHGWFLTRQFENEANPEMHSRTTAREIVDDFELAAVDEAVDEIVDRCVDGGFEPLDCLGREPPRDQRPLCVVRGVVLGDHVLLLRRDARPVATAAREDVGSPLDLDERRVVHDGPQVVLFVTPHRPGRAHCSQRLVHAVDVGVEGRGEEIGWVHRRESAIDARRRPVLAQTVVAARAGAWQTSEASRDLVQHANSSIVPFGSRKYIDRMNTSPASPVAS